MKNLALPLVMSMVAAGLSGAVNHPIVSNVLLMVGVIFGVVAGHYLTEALPNLDSPTPKKKTDTVSVSDITGDNGEAAPEAPRPAPVWGQRQQPQPQQPTNNGNASPWSGLL